MYLSYYIHRPLDSVEYTGIERNTDLTHYSKSDDPVMLSLHFCVPARWKLCDDTTSLAPKFPYR